MSHQLINRSPDLKRLRDEGFEVEVRGAFLLMSGVPYVDSNQSIKRGTLVSTLNLAGDKTTIPETHVVSFIGDHPCHRDGKPIEQIRHQIGNQVLADGLIINHSFSNKPQNGYADYYEKMTRYAEILSAPARSLDETVTAKTYRTITDKAGESPFHYLDTNSSRADMVIISEKVKMQDIAIVGLGGTGSYILDLASKTPARSIHTFDGDKYLQHNAFRAPGATSIETLAAQPNKSDHFVDIYSKLRNGIVSHPYYVNSSNLDELSKMSFVFLSIDNGPSKKIIVTYLIENGIPFVDVGMGLQIIEDQIIGILRATSGFPGKTNHIGRRISFGEAENNDYMKNIQISELNALNAAMAVIKWKKWSGIYQDLELENNSTYSLNVNMLQSEDHET